MKKLSILMVIIVIGLLCFSAFAFRKTIIETNQKEIADIKEILSKGYVKILFVNYEDKVIIGQLPDGSKKRVHVIFGERKPKVDELWRVVEDKQRLKLTTQYVP